MRTGNSGKVAETAAVRACVYVFMIAVFVMVSVFHTGTSPARARSPRGGGIDRDTKTSIIDSLAAALEETYVFPDIAGKIEKLLRRKLKKKDYESLNTLDAFTRRLTEDMERIAHDGHLWIRPASEDQILGAQKENPFDDPELIARQAYVNYGFEKVERLDANIGYLKFNNFSDARHAGETAVAALNFLANCDAIIIDLRENGGGSPSMVQLISSYFFKEPVHLNTFYIRASDSNKQFWTQAHVRGKRMTETPLFILTSRMTFSGAEEFTYNMKNLGRATIIGETTGGGAHPTRVFVFADLRVMASVPFGRAINPITGTNWEGTGVEPHMQVPRADALDVAELEALKLLHDRYDDGDRRTAIAFAIERFEALRNPAAVDPDILERWVGVYGPRRITLENGDLWYQREDRPKYRMIPVSQTLFCFEEIDYFKLQVETDGSGNPVALVGIYNMGRTDRSPKNTD